MRKILFGLLMFLIATASFAQVSSQLAIDSSQLQDDEEFKSFYFMPNNKYIFGFVTNKRNFYLINEVIKLKGNDL